MFVNVQPNILINWVPVNYKNDRVHYKKIRVEKTNEFVRYVKIV